MSGMSLRRSAESQHPTARRVALRGGLIALMAFLTVVDLFATQAILPTLAMAYGVSPAAMGTAVNATTFGMAAASLGVAFFGHRIDRRAGIVTSLLLLAVPTALLATAPGLGSFATLRVAQGLFMASAFTLTLAHLGERCSASDASGAFAAYVTGNVASNLIGRVISGWLADHVGLAANFYGFAVLNLVGAVLAFFAIDRVPKMRAMVHERAMPAGGAWAAHLRSPPLRAAFGIGFCILFAFIGTFTYVNFLLVGPKFGLMPMELALVYFVFLPSIVSTPLAGRLVRRAGPQRTMLGGLGVAALGVGLTLSADLVPVLSGLALIGIGTFLAQATATAFVSRAAGHDRAAASGMYLASYFFGGLAGSALLGTAFEIAGWPGCAGGVAVALMLAACLTRFCRHPKAWSEVPG